MQNSFLNQLILTAGSLLLLFPISNAYANDVTGNYVCQDYHAATKTTYTSKTKIEKINDVYHVSWSFNDGSQFSGTGLLSGNVLSIVYKQTVHAKFEKKFEETRFGLAQYTISDQKLSGRWIYYDTNTIGKEECKKSLK